MNENNDLKVSLGEAIHATNPKVEDYLFHEKPASTQGRLSRPLLGLPLRRLIPQDVHSLLDYSSGLALIASAGAAESRTAACAGVSLGAMLIGISAITDYRLSLAKWVPIEMHEVSDYVGGISAVAAPFALGYHRKNPVASWIQIGVGVTTIVASLFTNYRAQRGIKLR